MEYTLIVDVGVATNSTHVPHKVLAEGASMKGALYMTSFCDPQVPCDAQVRLVNYYTH